MTDTDHEPTNDTGARPWWASDGPVGRGPDPREDPIEVHRAARRGAVLDDAQPWWAGPATVDGAEADDAAASAAGDAAAGPADDAARATAADDSDDDAASATADDDADQGPTTAVHRPELCGICPICTGFRALEELRPDLVTHLSEAARHLAAAFRALAETTSPPPTRERDTDSAPPTVQHIDLD